MRKFIVPTVFVVRLGCTNYIDIQQVAAQYSVGESHCCDYLAFVTARRTRDRMSSVRPSVCPFVTLVDCDHIGWNSSEIIL